jgi:hypothetical protein
VLHERLRDVLVQLVIADPEGSAIDYGRDAISQGDGGHGKHGTTSAPPPRVNPIAHEWAEFFARALDMAELDLATLQGRAQVQPRRIGSGGRVASSIANARKRRIATSPVYQGRPSAFVAYVEGCSEDLVTRTRGEKGLDSFGLRVKRNAVTANPRHVFSESATTTTEDPT